MSFGELIFTISEVGFGETVILFEISISGMDSVFVATQLEAKLLSKAVSIN
jgi:hypothetical protein